MRPLIADVPVEIAPVVLKTCPKCGETKPTTAFYRDKYTKDRLHCYCKPCAKAKGRRGYYKHLDKILAQKAERRKEPGWHALQKPSLEVYRLRNKDKVNARQKTRRAVAKGEIEKLPCETCGSQRSYPASPRLQQAAGGPLALLQVPREGAPNLARGAGGACGGQMTLRRTAPAEETI